MRLGEMAVRADEFQAVLADARARSGFAADFPWYLYDSLGNFCTLRELAGPDADLLALTEGLPLLDIGCADGHMALFLDSIGCKVHAIDNPGTNCNHMRGARRLGEVLGAGVEWFERDIDQCFTLPASRYGLAVLLGVLYHVKNPFLVLETLSRHAKYLLLSTRVTRYGPDRVTLLDGLPLAYLVDPDETNNDSTNFWMFTPLGLERLLARSGWSVIKRTTGGNPHSDPVTCEGDERMFVLCENARNPVIRGQMMHGWHPQENWESWRWTERCFSARFPAPGRTLRIDVHVPESVLRVCGSACLRARVNGVDLPEQTFVEEGAHQYLAAVPAMADGPVLVECELAKAIAPEQGDGRELGIVVGHMSLA